METIGVDDGRYSPDFSHEDFMASRSPRDPGPGLGGGRGGILRLQVRVTSPGWVDRDVGRLGCFMDGRGGVRRNPQCQWRAVLRLNLNMW